MRTTEIELLDTTCRVERFLKLSHFEFHAYGDGSYCDLMSSTIYDPYRVLELAKPCKIIFIPYDDKIKIRIFENYEEG